MIGSGSLVGDQPDALNAVSILAGHRALLPHHQQLICAGLSHCPPSTITNTQLPAS